jgi:hypothetical protein
MSAHILSEKHINLLVNAAFFTGHNCGKFSIYYEGKTHQFNQNHNELNCEKLGQILVDQNYRSVNERYNETNKSPRFVFKFNPLPMVALKNIVQIFKACDCYDYQACETDDYYDTKARSIIDEIRDHLISQLPGYDEAEWSID